MLIIKEKEVWRILYEVCTKRTIFVRTLHINWSHVFQYFYSLLDAMLLWCLFNISLYNLNSNEASCDMKSKGDNKMTKENTKRLMFPTT